MPTEPELLPVGKRILVKEIKIENKTKSGFILPDEDKPKNGPTQGLIIEVGQKLENNLQPGMRILFNKFAPVSVSRGGENYLIINENDVLMIYKISNE